MRKKLLSLAIYVMAFISVNAQQLEISNVSPVGIPTIKATSQGNELYAAYFEDKPENEKEAFVVAMYNSELMEMKRVHLDVSSTSSLIASTSDGESYLLVFADAGKKTRTMMVLDRNGNVRRKLEEENVSPTLLKAENYKSLQTLTPDFMMVNSDGNDYTVQRYDMMLQPGPKYSFSLENGKWDIRDLQFHADMIFALLRENTNGKFKYQVQAIRTADGKQLYKTTVGENSHLMLSPKMQIDEKLNAVLGGLFFIDGEFENAPGGLYAMKIDMNGNILNSMKKPFDEMKMHSDNKIIKGLGDGSLDIFIEDAIAQADNRYTFIGEIFEKTNGGAGTASFSVKDLVLINAGPSVEDSINVEIIPKPAKKATVRGNGALANKYALAENLYNKHFFAYRKGTPIPEKTHVMYRNDYDGNVKLGFAAVPDSMGRVIADLDFGDPDKIVKTSAEERVAKKGKEAKAAKKLPIFESEIDLGNYKDPEQIMVLRQLIDNKGFIYSYRENDRKLKIETFRINE